MLSQLEFLLVPLELFVDLRPYLVHHQENNVVHVLIIYYQQVHHEIDQNIDPIPMILDEVEVKHDNDHQA